MKSTGLTKGGYVVRLGQSILLILGLLASLRISKAGPPKQKPWNKFDKSGCVKILEPQRGVVPATSERLQWTKTVDTCGGGSISITVGDSFDPEDKQYIYDLFNDVYPVAVRLYGAPCRSNLNVTVERSSPYCVYKNCYIGYPSATIVVHSDPADPANSYFDSIFLHELLHAFHDGAYFSEPWAEESITESGVTLVAKYLESHSVRNIDHDDPDRYIHEYDRKMEQGQAVFTLGFGGAYRIEFWWILLAAESTALSGVWEDYDFFRKLNEAVYNYISTASSHLTAEALFQLVDTASPYPIDGMQAGTWLKKQPLARSCAGPDGTFLDVFANEGGKEPGGKDFLHLMITPFTRSIDEEGNCHERRIPSLPIDITVQNAQGTTVCTDTIIIDEGGLFIGSVEWGPTDPGAYKIVATSSINGRAVSGRSYFLAGEGTRVSTTEDGIGFIIVEGKGNLSTTEILGSTDGTFSFNTNAGAVLKPYFTDSIPLSTTVYTVPLAEPVGPVGPYRIFLPMVFANTKKMSVFSIPLPYTRILVFHPWDDS